ncbi:MAG TPA: XRE family transcriptional regulator [Mucilaginibacter sp.]|jgi:transcriptional regulator with XRE-family HTH domain
MTSNQLNSIDGIDPEIDALKKLGNRIKTLRMKAGYHHYEKFAGQHDIGRILLRRAELGGNVKYNSLLKIIQALGVTPAEFFSDGFD